MIVRNIAELTGTKREVITANWTSRRILLHSDGMGFSLHETVIAAGTETPMHYRNHLEAVFCVAGEGEIELTDTGTRYGIGPGIVYALNRHDRHILRARTPLRLICVFNPPLHGREVHDIEGSYPRAGENPTLHIEEIADDIANIRHL